MLLLALALQAVAPPPSTGSAPERFSILVPVKSQPCTRSRAADEIVVCADPLPEQALPLPAEAVSPFPTAVNPRADGVGALNAEATPCAASVGGCQAGIDVFGMGTALIRGVQKLVAPNSCCEEAGEATNPFLLVRDVAKGAKSLGKRKPAAGERVAIDLSEPVTSGRVAP